MSWNHRHVSWGDVRTNFPQLLRVLGFAHSPIVQYWTLDELKEALKWAEYYRQIWVTASAEERTILSELLRQTRLSNADKLNFELTESLFYGGPLSVSQVVYINPHCPAHLRLYIAQVILRLDEAKKETNSIGASTLRLSIVQSKATQLEDHDVLANAKVVAAAKVLNNVLIRTSESDADGFQRLLDHQRAAFEADKSFESRIIHAQLELLKGQRDSVSLRICKALQQLGREPL